MSRRKKLGDKGENLALKKLRSKGYRILDRNFRTPEGEIDIIAQKNKTLIFIEVKTRSTDKFGLAEEAITPQKIKKIIKAGQKYHSLHPKLPELMRVDAVVIKKTDHQKETLEIIENISF